MAVLNDEDMAVGIPRFAPPGSMQSFALPVPVAVAAPLGVPSPVAGGNTQSADARLARLQSLGLAPRPAPVGIGEVPELRAPLPAIVPLQPPVSPSFESTDGSLYAPGGVGMQAQYTPPAPNVAETMLPAPAVEFQDPNVYTKVATKVISSSAGRAALSVLGLEAARVATRNANPNEASGLVASIKAGEGIGDIVVGLAKDIVEAPLIVTGKADFIAPDFAGISADLKRAAEQNLQRADGMAPLAKPFAVVGGIAADAAATAVGIDSALWAPVLDAGETVAVPTLVGGLGTVLSTETTAKIQGMFSKASAVVGDSKAAIVDEKKTLSQKLDAIKTAVENAINPPEPAALKVTRPAPVGVGVDAEPRAPPAAKVSPLESLRTKAANAIAEVGAGSRTEAAKIRDALGGSTPKKQQGTGSVDEKAGNDSVGDLVGLGPLPGHDLAMPSPSLQPSPSSPPPVGPYPVDMYWDGSAWTPGDMPSPYDYVRGHAWSVWESHVILPHPVDFIGTMAAPSAPSVPPSVVLKAPSSVVSKLPPLTAASPLAETLVPSRSLSPGSTDMSLLSKAKTFAQQHPAALGAAGSAVVLGVPATAYVAEQIQKQVGNTSPGSGPRSRLSMLHRTTSHAPAKAKAHHKRKAKRQSAPAHKATHHHAKAKAKAKPAHSRKTSHNGQKVYHTKHGQPYVIERRKNPLTGKTSNMARFIKK